MKEILVTLDDEVEVFVREEAKRQGVSEGEVLAEMVREELREAQANSSQPPGNETGQSPSLSEERIGYDTGISTLESHSDEDGRLPLSASSRESDQSDLPAGDPWYEIIGSAPDAPRDLSTNYKHYLYGFPKKSR